MQLIVMRGEATHLSGCKSGVPGSTLSATFFDSAFPTHKHAPEPAAPIIDPTADLDTTTDLPEDSTKDLAPTMTELEPAAMTDTTAFVDADDLPLPSPAAHENAQDSTEHVQPGRLSTTATPPMRGRAAPAEAPATLAPGVVLCDRFLLEQLIGSGGTAVVYQARDMASSTGAAPNKRIAIKAPRPDAADRARAAARLRHEFEHAQRLSHRDIVRVFELHEDRQCCFMTMELIEGRLLSRIVRDWTMLPRSLAYKILRSCGQALAYAHSRNVVHGDFKPGNVFVTRDEQVKVVDFSAAAGAGSSSRIPAGTAAYASPEVLGGQTPDRRDDVFSFACVAYELLTGQHPFDHHSSVEAREQRRIPPRAWNLSATQWLALLSALSWERAQRPAEIETVARALVPDSEQISQAVPIQPPAGAIPAELPQELMPPQRGWGFFIFVACALAVTFIASQRQGGPEPPAGSIVSAQTAAAPMPALPVMGKAPNSSTGQDAADTMATSESAGKNAAASPLAADPAAAATSAGGPAQSAAPLSEISFEDRAIMTSEGSVAAVFLIKRSQPLNGRARVQWNASSGTADAGIDFAANAAGSIEFAAGQAQRAIYVPLRGDLLKENDETFTVHLHSAQQARLGGLSRAEATIRDDD